MRKSVNLKDQCTVILDYYIKNKFGGEGIVSVWRWFLNTVKSLDPSSNFEYRQLLCIYQDIMEGVRDFKGEQLTELSIDALEKGIELKLGKQYDWRLIKYFLKERDKINGNEFYILKKLYENYKDDAKLNSEMKIKIQVLLENSLPKGE